MSCTRWARAISFGTTLLLAAAGAGARPIVFADSAVVMAEYGAGNTREIQVFYAPRHFFSLGAGHLELDTVGDIPHEVTYARLNYLAKRWNMEGAQANVFVWGGVGSAFIGAFTPQVLQPGQAPLPGHGHGGSQEPGEVPYRRESFRETAWNAGGQIDYETLRIYTSFKTDTHRSSTVSHRVDSLQFGFSPYGHEVDSLAAWLIVSGRRYSGDQAEGDEVALLLRLFRKNTWVEAGATLDGEVRAMAMFSF
jgi:hypothetical protein